MSVTINSPQVSVVMSVFNSEKWLNECIDSVLNQTFHDFEFIIVNDGSTDQSQKILREYAYRDSRIIVITKVNSGISQSVNIGVERACGDLIARIDADDVCKPDRFKKQVAYLNRHKDVALVSGAVEYIDEHGKVFGRTYPITSIKQIRDKMLNFGNIIVQPAVMMRRDSFNSCGGYCSGLITGEDGHLWRKFIRNGFNLSILPDVLISYRVSTSAISNMTRTNTYEALYREILEYDNPPKYLIDAIEQEIKYIRSKNFSFKSRKYTIYNSIHCKIWRILNKIGVNNKFSEFIICKIRNILNY